MSAKSTDDAMNCEGVGSNAANAKPVDGTPKARNKPPLNSKLILPNVPAFSLPYYSQC